MRKSSSKEQRYEKPLLVKYDGLVFTDEIWQGFNRGACCRPCSACHGCR
jgi:hypothetical protein